MMKKITLLSFILVNLLILNTKSFAQNLNNVDWDNKYSIEINNTFIDAELNNWTLVFDQNFSSLLTAANGPLDADGSRPSINGGGDIRFSSDENGTTELAFDIRTWVTDNDPNTATCEVAVNIPVVSETNNTTIYMWWGNSSANTYGVDHDYGQYNAYNTDQIAMISGNEDASTDFSDRLNKQWTVVSGGNRPTQTTGLVGSAYAFDTDKGLEAVNESDFDGIESSGSISIMAIAKPIEVGPTIQNFRVLVSRGDDYSSESKYAFVQDRINNEMEFPIDRRGNTTRVLASIISTTLGDWYGWGLDAEDNSTAKLVLNGVEQSLLNNITNEISLSGSTNLPVRIGIDQAETSRSWNGLIDELRIFSKTQSVAAHKAYFHNMTQSSGFLTFADATLGNNSNAVENIGIYPNPTQNSWTIRANNQMINSVEIYNVLGERVLYTKPNTGSITINASNLAPGLYFSTINTDLGSVTKKLIKN